MSWAGTAMGCGLSLAVVLGAFAWATEGFSLLTAEEARRRAVAREAPALPSLQLASPSQAIGAPPRDWAALMREDGRPTVLHFVYTGCRTLCAVQSAQTRSLQREIESLQAQAAVRLVTVSFDPLRDTLPVLQTYGERLGASAPVWTLWRPTQEAQLPAALKALGIVVLPDDNGEFVHNAAWLVVDAQARLRAIVPQEQPRRALRLALALAGPGKAPS